MRYLVSGTTRTLRNVLAHEPNAHTYLGGLTTPRSNPPATLVALQIPWALDNDAYSGFDPVRFLRVLEAATALPRCLFIVCPDVVADASATLTMFDEWEPVLRGAGQPVAFVGQDGQEDLPVPWERIDAYFIGGSTAWKLSPASYALAQEARGRGLYVHMGRVNSFARMQIAHEWGCDSVDGTSASRWGRAYIARYVRFLASLDRQGVFFP